MTTPVHLGGAHHDKPDYYTWLPGVWERLILKYEIRSVLDVGCGAGWSTEWFSQRVPGRVLGIEGDPAAHDARVRRCDAIIKHDFAEGMYVPKSLYDLGIAFEFVEHVEAKYMRNWMRALQACRYVCITFAKPGQGGHHHVNEQEEPYWLDRFKGCGFAHVSEETAFLRGMPDGGEAWGRPTLTFFRNTVFGHPDPSWLLPATVGQ